MISRDSALELMCSDPVAVMYSRDDLSEEVSGLALRDVLLVPDVVVQISFTGVLHHDHDLILILKH